jgi:hypothetical protein
MRSTGKVPDTPRIRRVRRRLEGWRQKRPHQRAAFPRALWTAAVMLAREHGLYPTARALGINYGALKAHVERAERVTSAAERPTFVELARGLARQESECVIEFSAPRGTTRLRVRGLNVADVVALARALGGGEA